mmetsp:Transcript_5573/g.13889  ORF Transcript_5573/g.13889 Transcript_5573/m.13889 type:complete len:254 (+) Transcript_5573:1-762(+)
MPMYTHSQRCHCALVPTMPNVRALQALPANSITIVRAALAHTSKSHITSTPSSPHTQHQHASQAPQHVCRYTYALCRSKELRILQISSDLMISSSALLWAAARDCADGLICPSSTCCCCCSRICCCTLSGWCAMRAARSARRSTSSAVGRARLARGTPPGENALTSTPMSARNLGKFWSLMARACFLSSLRRTAWRTISRRSASTAAANSFAWCSCKRALTRAAVASCSALLACAFAALTLGSVPGALLPSPW